MKIEYIEVNWKYTTKIEHVFPTKIIGHSVDTKFIKLAPDGLLTIAKMYSWDGVSGPSITTSTTIRGSLIHDALYQLLRLQKLPADLRQAADKEFYDCIVEDGVFFITAKYFYIGLRLFGKAAAVGTLEKDKLEP